MYKNVLDRLDQSARILEVGIGNGACINKNAHIIKKKNLTIEGIDIDSNYLAVCNRHIYHNNLELLVFAKKQDLLTIDSEKTEKYDYVFFIESFPVISQEIMSKMITKCKDLLKPTGKIVFVNNLVSKKNWFVNFIKPKIVHIPFIWVDFGRLVTHEEMEIFCKTKSIQIEKKELILSVLLSEKFSFVPNWLDYKMDQYYIICSI